MLETSNSSSIWAILNSIAAIVAVALSTADFFRTNKSMIERDAIQKRLLAIEKARESDRYYEMNKAKLNASLLMGDGPNYYCPASGGGWTR